MANATFGEWCWGNSVWNEMVGEGEGKECNGNDKIVTHHNSSPWPGVVVTVRSSAVYRRIATLRSHLTRHRYLIVTSSLQICAKSYHRRLHHPPLATGRGDF